MSEPIFSERLRATMVECMTNQEKLATAVGVSQGSVSGWLNGATPSADKLAKIARHLRVNADWLIAGHGPKKPKFAASINSMSQAEMDAATNQDSTDWRSRALEAERKLEALKKNLIDLVKQY